MFLIEAADVEMGAELSRNRCRRPWNRVIEAIERDFFARCAPRRRTASVSEITAEGYLRLDSGLAASRFPSDAVAAVVRRRAVADSVAWPQQRRSAAETTQSGGRPRRSGSRRAAGRFPGGRPYGILGR